MDITITDMWDAKRRLDEFPYVISIMDPYGPFPQKAENHFIARFEDSEYDVSGPCIWDIRGILDNARDWGLTKDSKILIHCMAGISRSTAIAWAILVLVIYRPRGQGHPPSGSTRSLAKFVGFEVCRQAP